MHPLIRSGQPRPASAFFDDFVKGVQNKPLLLDHIGLSPGLSTWLNSARIANTDFDVEIQPRALNGREQLPSDHRPVFALLTPPH
jgi:hypothetical protein